MCHIQILANEIKSRKRKNLKARLKSWQRKAISSAAQRNLNHLSDRSKCHRTPGIRQKELNLNTPLPSVAYASVCINKSPSFSHLRSRPRSRNAIIRSREPTRKSIISMQPNDRLLELFFKHYGGLPGALCAQQQYLQPQKLRCRACNEPRGSLFARTNN